MELIRKWAGQSWTDHNVHDPGITILEACSYAMTELADGSSSTSVIYCAAENRSGR